MRNKLRLAVFLVFLAAPCVGQERAASSVHYEVFTDKAAFLAAVGEVILQGFESYPTYECSSGGPSPVTYLESESFTVTTVPAEGGTSFLCTGSRVGGSPGPTDGKSLTHQSSSVAMGRSRGPDMLHDLSCHSDAVGSSR